MFSATGSAIQLGHLPSDRWLAVLPLCHVAGLSIVMRCALLGTTVVVHPAFDAPRVAEAIRDGACTLVSLVPTMLRRLLEEPLEPRAGRFRTVLLGGGFIAPELLASCRERGLPVAPTYGMTEASSQIATAPPGTAVADAGFPLVWTQVEVRSGVEVVEPGADGELWVRGPTVTPGTLDAAGTLEPRRGAWLATGDFVRETDLGRLQVVDRRTDRIVSGGENVHPSEVEAVLEAHAHVARACVVGLPDPEWGHRVVAAVTLADGSGLPELTSRLLVEHCRAQLAPYKVPKTVVVFEDLPRSALGKLNRREVRARLLARGQDDKQRSTQGLS
ncbi:MAG: AMP-binding protein [Myxococcota bacterium]